MTTLAITGIGEPLGLRLTERARERGWQVQGLELSINARARAEQAGALVVQGDVTDPIAVDRALAGADFVVHAAEIRGGARPALYQDVNVYGTRIVAAAARDLGVERFVHLSSTRVYAGEPGQTTEAGPFKGAEDVYAQSKIKSEIAAWSQHKKSEMEVTVLRLGEVYGPGSAATLARSLELWAKNELVLPGHESEPVHHLHVDNLIDALLLVLARGASGQMLNITDGLATARRDYFGCLLEQLQRRGMAHESWSESFSRGLRTAFACEKRRYASPTTPLPPKLQAVSYDLGQARRLLGYVPRVSLAQGMHGVAEALRTTGLHRDRPWPIPHDIFRGVEQRERN